MKNASEEELRNAIEILKKFARAAFLNVRDYDYEEYWNNYVLDLNEGLKRAKESDQIIDGKIDSLVIHDEGNATISATIHLHQPCEFVFIPLAVRTIDE